MYRVPHVLLGLLSLASNLLTANLLTAQAADPAASPREVFEQRILPIFASPKPSSCVQCHLASVDLKNYILPSAEATFHALRAEGLIDVQAPHQSKILQLIKMGEDDPDVTARRIHARTREAELEAFTSWLEACCRDPQLLAATPPADTPHVGPEKPLEIVRHNRKDRVLDAFVRHVWSQRMRCFPCHTPHELQSDNPQHAQPRQRHAEYVAQYGQKMNLFLETPEQTLHAWLASARKPPKEHLPLINLEQPAHSLLLLKPTSKVPAADADGKPGTPASNLPVSHVGGLKMHPHDHSYKAILSWINDLATVSRDGYQLRQEVRSDQWYPSDQFLKLIDAPEAWPALSTLQMFIFARDVHSGQWCDQPLAFTQALVTPRRIAQGPLFHLVPNAPLPPTGPAAAYESVASDKPAASDDQRSTKIQLPAGDYLIRVYHDSDRQLESHPERLLHTTSAPSVSAEIHSAWPSGFSQATPVDGHQLQ